MGIFLLVLVMAVLFAGLGFAIHLLWIAAVIMFACWVAGFAFSRGSSRGARR
ncbi:MAG TPA: hypothetical protein VN781_02865 [Acidimicrobiales bacterium]|nr:hypothetical protein [Acidimicrobiales bacterium]